MIQAASATPSQDDVAVYDGYSQVFRAARPMKATVKETAKLMEHPIESGVMVTDHKVLRPVEISLSCILEPGAYRDTYAEIRKLYVESAFLTIQARSGTYENMVIESLPHEEDPEMANTIGIEIRLKEVVVVTAEYAALPQGKVENPDQSSTTNGGEVQPQEQKGSLGYEILKKRREGNNGA